MSIQMTHLVLKQVGTTLFLLLDKNDAGYQLPTATLSESDDLYTVAKAQIAEQLGVGVKSQFGVQNCLSLDGGEINRPFAVFHGPGSDVGHTVLVDVVLLEEDLAKEKLQQYQWQMLGAVESLVEAEPNKFHAVD